MAKEVCSLCAEKIETGFMDKILGTQVTVRDGEKKTIHLVCSACQKEHGSNLLEKLK